MISNVKLLPFDTDLETIAVLRKLKSTCSALAELKGSEDLLPNKSILINTLFLQEAKDSSAVENIITTHDELFRSDSSSKKFQSIAAKEVYAYKDALNDGYSLLQKTNLILTSHILKIQSTIEQNKAGFRKTPGTVLRNEETGETVYTPPQHIDDIEKLMKNLEDFINNTDLCSWDPLVKMAVIHYQFESIHPFYDGNGRTGRIINILYIVKENLLTSPILYMSRYINANKSKYYSLLQSTRDTGLWEEWILFMLEGVEQTAKNTIFMIKRIREMMLEHKHIIRTQLPRIYSQDLLNNIYKHPYTKIELMMKDLKITRLTASRYLNELVRIGVLEKMKFGRDNFYINKALFDLIKTI